MHYDFESFLNSVKYLDKEDILETAYKRHKALDKITVVDKKEGGSFLQDHIQYLLYFLEKGERPVGMTNENFQKLKPLCENLIKKDQLPKEVWELF